jgi:hypothetical protein
VLNAAMNIHTQITVVGFCFPFFNVFQLPEMKFLDHVVNFCIIFLRTAMLFSHFIFLTTNAQEFQYFHSFANSCHFLSWFVSLFLQLLLFGMVWFYDNSYPNGSKVALSSCLDFHFPKDY